MYASIRTIPDIAGEFAALESGKEKAAELKLTDIDRAPGSGKSIDQIAHQQGMCRCDGDGDFIVTGSVKNISKTSSDHPYFYVVENWRGSKKVNGKDYYTYIIDSNDHTRFTHPGGIQVAENVLAIGTGDYSGVTTSGDRSHVRFYDIGNTSNITEFTGWRIYREGSKASAAAVGLIKTEFKQWVLVVCIKGQMDFYITPVDTAAGVNSFRRITTLTYGQEFQGINLFFQSGLRNQLYIIGTSPEGATDMLYLYRVDLRYDNNAIAGFGSLEQLSTVHMYSANSDARFKWAACTYINPENHFEIYDATMHVDNREIRMNRWTRPAWPKDAYITDITVVSDPKESVAKARCPAGYSLINMDLNQGARGDYIYFCVKPGTRENAITNILCDVSDKSKSAATVSITHNGVTASYSRNGADLNKGAGGKFLYLLSTRSTAYNPIRNITVYLDGESLPGEWNGKMCYVNTNETADLNYKAGGRYIYVACRR